VRIEEIVKDFLASTHMPARQRQLVDVKDVVQRIAKLLAPRTAKLGARVELNVADDLPPIRMVPTDLEQVLLNLANNAVDALEHSPNGRLLAFGVTTSGSDRKHLEIRVQDTGEGIPPQNIKQVLKPFFTTKAPGQGTGLGLTISQRLLKKYGGKLELDSVLGKGTTITVSIPYDAP
jgi:two-component system NtrC family sensor kinase